LPDQLREIAEPSEVLPITAQEFQHGFVIHLNETVR
jgi:hypothetical protein